MPIRRRRPRRFSRPFDPSVLPLRTSEPFQATWLGTGLLEKALAKHNAPERLFFDAPEPKHAIVLPHPGDLMEPGRIPAQVMNNLPLAIEGHHLAGFLRLRTEGFWEAGDQGS